MIIKTIDELKKILNIPEKFIKHIEWEKENMGKEYFVPSSWDIKESEEYNDWINTLTDEEFDILYEYQLDK